ncbi:metallophosphoesterase family protein [Nocardioides yefusunii]|uniref:Metallophosphoesterase n=1 Tax=Nocardioides yefusunii TaxID=2500546 RepID=A0ABW1QSE8_9ACTN|nr:metallophosphoesterase [Nocardioides yefusunii]
MGDVHGDAEHAGRLVDVAVGRGATCIVQVGDFGYWAHHPSGVEFLDTVDARSREAGVRWIFVDGNHDNVGHLRVHHTHLTEDGFVHVRDAIAYAPRGHVWTWHGLLFGALGGAVSTDKWERLNWEKRHRKPESLWFPDEETTDAEAQVLVDRIERLDVLLTHDKPRATDPWIHRKDTPDCWPNQDRIQRVVEALRPRLVVHGHLHYRYTDQIDHPEGDRTRVEGLGCDPAATPWQVSWSLNDAWLWVDLTRGLDDVLAGEPIRQARPRARRHVSGAETGE